MGREAGGGIGMGNTCKSMADSCQCMTKTTTKKKRSGYTTLLTKVWLVKAVVFPLVMYGCWSWTIKKAEH